MVSVAKVSMFGMPVGTFYWDERYNVANFEYNDDFVERGIDPSPLVMPLRRGRTYSFGSLNRDTYKGLPGMLADSLPDTYGRALFDRWLSMTGRQSGNALETLCFMGKRCMGALEFEPAFESGDLENAVEVSALVDVANRALSEKQDFEANINEDRRGAIAAILRLGTSAGGQRAKAIIAYNKATGEVRSGQVDAPEGFDYYFIKLDGVSGAAGFRVTENYGRLEYSYSLLARECGIEMSECSLIEDGARTHFLTKRFDRVDGRKLHLQTLCGLAHYDFRLHRAYSYEQVFNVMRGLKLPYSQEEEMFRRMVFNVVARNQDDHTKNISFLMDEAGKWRLSPAYDLTYAYNPTGNWTSTHQMSVNGKFDGIGRSDLLACADTCGIRNADGIIDGVCSAVSTWPSIAASLDIPQSLIAAILPNLMADKM
ncbi:MAG: type II toxin-antitoxin system HipA family toxin [Bacteroidales bacterium]|nr:type II toxin-antitoxin system HipA family toxin [Bacteroidales bacterium]